MIKQYFLLLICKFKNIIFGSICSLLLLTFSMAVWGQSSLDNDIVISDLNFSRFVLFVRPTASFLSHPKAKSWRALLEKNLCWSGTFKLYQPQNSYCRTNKGRVDMQLALEIRKNGTSQTLKLIVADNSGVPLFWKIIELEQNKLQENDVIDAVNEITEKLTEQPGILGTTIAFTLRQPGYKKVIAKTDTHGQNITPISHNSYRNISPKWNLDGTRIIYTRVGPKQSVIYDDLQGLAVALTKPGMKSSGGSWGPDGKSIVLTLNINTNADIYSLNLETQSLERLTKNQAIDTVPSISPDGSYILFVSDRARRGQEQIYVMYYPTKEILRMTFTGSRNTDPVWNPDGSLIAFTKKVRAHNQIYLMDIYGENEQALTKGPYDSEQPEWSPDGRQIIFTSKRNKGSKLYTIFIDGKGLRRVTNTLKGFEEKKPTWTQRRF